MNWYFYKIWIPLQLATLISFVLIFLNYVDLNWWVIFVAWFLVGPVGTGVGYHRLFSHRQFQTWKPIEYALAVLGTLAAYAPVLFWASQHQYHHKVTDTKDDPSSPRVYGFWESFLMWRMRASILKKIDLRNYCIRLMLKDKFLMFVSKHFTKIIWMWALLLLTIDLNLFVNLFIIPAFIEHIRVNLVSSVSHLKIPLSYKNYQIDDNSYNNVILGYLTFGFGWHNNHHTFPRELVNKHKWWEIDVEGLVAKALSKNEATKL